MLHLASIGLSCMLLLGTFVAPCPAPAASEEDVSYRDTPIVYDVNAPATYASSSESFTIEYDTRDYDKFDLAIFHPTYSFTPTAGACAPIAGANLVGFYDRYDENLIPDHKSGTLIGTGYSYAIEDTAVQNVIRELYSLMGTDETGTTEDAFLDGLESYCRNKGKSISTYSCMSGGSFDLSKAQSYIRSNIPIVFFLSGYNVGSIFQHDHADALTYYKSDANHIMVGFGYANYTYHISGTTSTYHHFKIASGLSGRSSGIYDIALDTTINDALAIQIN